MGGKIVAGGIFLRHIQDNSLLLSPNLYDFSNFCPRLKVKLPDFSNVILFLLYDPIPPNLLASFDPRVKSRDLFSRTKN